MPELCCSHGGTFGCYLGAGGQFFEYSARRCYRWQLCRRMGLEPGVRAVRRHRSRLARQADGPQAPVVSITWDDIRGSRPFLALPRHFRPHSKVLAHTTTSRYTNYTFVSPHGAIHYAIRLREAPHTATRDHAASAADPA